MNGLKCGIQTKKWILSIMYKNMVSDINAGYDVMGKSITRQKTIIADYEKSINNTLDMFVNMDEKQIDKWCFYDMLKRGAIA